MSGHNPVCSCSNPVYRCPACKRCYCDHRYDKKRFTWKCPDGTIISLGDHEASHRVLWAPRRPLNNV